MIEVITSTWQHRSAGNHSPWSLQSNCDQENCSHFAGDRGGGLGGGTLGGSGVDAAN